MNNKGIYSGFIAIIAIGLMLFVAISSNAAVYSGRTEVYKARFRDVPLIVQNAYALYGNATEKSITDFYILNPCTKLPIQDNFLANFDSASAKLSSLYAMDCTSTISGFDIRGANPYSIDINTTLSCQASAPFNFSFSKSFKIMKTLTLSGLWPCSVSISDR